MKFVWLFCLILPVFAQDAVNPCTVDTEDMDCTVTDAYPAEVDLRAIKLNGKRKDDPVVADGEDLVVTAKIKYTKRAKAQITTTFTSTSGATCPDRVEFKRVKPEAIITYNASLAITGGSTLNYSGNGLEFTIPGGDLTGASSAVLNVIFTVTGSLDPDCIALPYPTESKTFTLIVDDGSWTGVITAEVDDDEDDTDYTGTKRKMPATVVDDHSYFLVDQDRKLKFTANFTTAGGATASGSDISWAVTPAGAGTFNSHSGKTVKWRQGNYQSLSIDDVVITATGPDNTTKDFFLTFFTVEPMEVTMNPNETRQFVVPESSIHPPSADKSIIEQILGPPNDVGTTSANGVRLRTREIDGTVENSGFEPSELSQTLFNSLVINRATYKHLGNTLVLEVESDDEEGDYYASWEVKRLLGSRRFLHHDKIHVVADPVVNTLTLVKDGTNDPGPFNLPLSDTLSIKALTSAVNFPPTSPVWTIDGPPGNALVVPDVHDDLATFQFNVAGVYTFKIVDGADTDEMVVNVYGIDIDIDSDNDNNLAPTANSPAEDLIEENSPGKIIFVSNNDTDGDRIPDYADGYNHWTTGALATNDNASTHSLTPIILRLPEPSDPAVAHITLTYNDENNPVSITSDSDPILPAFLTGSGKIRLWRYNGNQARDQYTDFFTNTTYNASDFGLTAASREVILYLEAVKPSDNFGDLSLEVELDYDGVGPLGVITSDKVVFTAAQVDITPGFPRLVTGTPTTFTAVGKPTGGSYSWTVTAGAANVDITGGTTSATLNLTGNTYSTAIDTVQLRASYALPVPGGTPPLSAHLVKPIPIVSVGYIRDDGDANPNDDPWLSQLEVSNLVVDTKIGPGDGHQDPDNFKIQVSGPITSATIDVDVESLTPAGASFSPARKVTRTLTRVGTTNHYRSTYQRLVVDDKDQGKEPANTLLVDWDSGTDTTEILGQKIDTFYQLTPTYYYSNQKEVGNNVRTFNVAAHYLTGTAGVNTASLRKRIKRDVRRLYAQTNMKPQITQQGGSDLLEQVASVKNYASISHNHGKKSTGGSTMDITVDADRGALGIVTWDLTHALTANKTPKQTADAIVAAFATLAPTVGGSPADRVTVQSFQNPSISGAGSGFRSADLMFTDPAGGTVTVTTSSSDANQDIAAPLVDHSILIVSKSGASLVGSIQQRSLIRNYDHGPTSLDIYGGDLVERETGENLRGRALIHGTAKPGYEQSLPEMRNNAFVKANSLNNSSSNPYTLAHEIGHNLLDATHADTDDKQMMRDGGTEGSNDWDHAKRIYDSNVHFNSIHKGPAGWLNQVTAMRGSTMTSAKRAKPQLEPHDHHHDESHTLASALHQFVDPHTQMPTTNRLARNLETSGTHIGEPSVGQQFISQLQTAREERLSQLIHAAGKLRIPETQAPLQALAQDLNKPLRMRLSALGSLLALGDQETVLATLPELLDQLPRMHNERRKRVLYLNQGLAPTAAQAHINAVLRIARQQLDHLNNQPQRQLKEIGAWSDLLNMAQRELIGFNLHQRSGTNINALINDYLIEYNDTQRSNRIWHTLLRLNQEEAIARTAQRKQANAEPIHAPRLLHLRDQLYDTLTDEELHHLEAH